MTAHPYTEDQLVEQPAIGLFAELGWQVAAPHPHPPPLSQEARGASVDETGLFGRETTGEVVLVSRLLAALKKLNSTLPDEAINVAVDELTRDRAAMGLEAANREIYAFLLVSQFSVTGALYTCRPDLVGFVNGLPLVVVELKKPGVAARTADWGRFFEWKRIERENEPRRVSLETLIRGTCDRARLLDLVENFTLFSELKAGLGKVIGQNHRYLGVNNAIVSMLAARQMGHGRAGVFWQTQGSGKSFSMVFFAQKVLRRLAGNWTFVVVTDRVELDDQIAKTFKAVGAVGETEGERCHATSGAHLRELLRGNHRYVFTLLQVSRSLTEEEQRHVRENLTEEELVVFDGD